MASYNKEKRKWRVRVKLRGKEVLVGEYHTKEEADREEGKFRERFAKQLEQDRELARIHRAEAARSGLSHRRVGVDNDNARRQRAFRERERSARRGEQRKRDRAAADRASGVVLPDRDAPGEAG